MRRHLSVQARWPTRVPTILAIGGAIVAFFLLPKLPGGSVVLGLTIGAAAAIIAKSKHVLTFNPADMTAREKRRLLAVTSALIGVGGLAVLAVAFFVPPDMWFGSAWLGSSLPSLKALLAYFGSFSLGLAFILASGLGRPVSR